MNCLVTGGAGFIGSNLVKLLLSKGHRVTVLDTLNTGFRSNLPLDQINFINGDIRDYSMVQKAVENAEAVFHLAASVGNTKSIEHPFIDATTNYIGTLNLLEASRHAGVKRFVFSSSAGIFGELKTFPISEDHPVEPDTPYGAAKLGAEKLALSYGKLYKMQVVALRYFNVYGPNQRYDEYGNVIPKFVFRLLKGEKIFIYGDGEQTRDFINSRDVALANYLAATSGVSGAFNVGSGTSITINKLADMILAALGKTRGSVEYAPPRAGDVRDSKADLSNISAKLGFTPSVTLEQGIPEYVAWAKRDFQKSLDL
jgi:UDP-glucose 4-epimerase